MHPTMERARTVRRIIPAPADDVFEFLTTITNHARLIPCTRIEAPSRPVVTGDVITAISAGVLRDVMVVTSGVDVCSGPCSGPRRVTLVKSGPILHGWAEIAVRELDDHSSEASWQEFIRLRHSSGTILTRAVEVMCSLALWRAAILVRPA